MNHVFTLIAFSIALFFGMVALQFFGRWIGRRSAGTESARAGAGVIEAAVFGLLGLVLAFQLSGAATRLALRRQLAVQEANAIGTAYLRLDFLPDDRQSELRALFARYTDARIAELDAMPDVARMDAEHATAMALQSAIWSKAVAGIKAATGTPAGMLLTPALNEMIDITTTRGVVHRTHAPWLIVWLLVALALMAALLAGLAMAASPRRLSLHMILFAAVTVATIYVTADLEFPSIGMVRLGEAAQALRDARAAMRY